MRVVLDTNILISSLLSAEGYPAQIMDLWIEKKFTLVTSLWQIEEFRATSNKTRVQKRLNRQQAGRLVNGIRRRALVLDELPEVDYSPDPDDNPIIAAALAGHAKYIVSGDKKDVQALGRS